MLFALSFSTVFVNGCVEGVDVRSCGSNIRDTEYFFREKDIYSFIGQSSNKDMKQIAEPKAPQVPFR
jgi:hypothetical protein